MESVTLNPENQVVDLLAGMVKQWQTARRAKIFRLRTKIINGPKKRFKVASDGSLYRRSFDLQLREQWSASVVGTTDADRDNYLPAPGRKSARMDKGERKKTGRKAVPHASTLITGPTKRVGKDLVDELDRPGVSARDEVGYDNRANLVAPLKVKDKLPRPRKK